jgi:rod shape-determining protein MreD
MAYYLLLPFLSILLVVLQTTIADIFFSGRIILELSMIIVIYAGFRLDIIRGAVLAFILGFVFDSIAGFILGLFTFIYIIIFLISFFVAEHLETEEIYFISVFTIVCTFLEEIICVLFYNLTYGFNMFYNIPFIFLMQALLAGLLAPMFFYLMRRVEVFYYDKTAQSAQRSRARRVSSEA